MSANRDRNAGQDGLNASGRDIFRHAFEVSMSGIAIVAADGRVLRANRAFCDVTGYGEEELQTLRFPAVAHPDDRAACLRLAADMAVGRVVSFHTELRFIHRQGHTVWAKFGCSRYREDGEALRYLLQIVEVTAYKQTENMLRDNDQRYRQLLKRLPEPIAIHSEGILIYLNDAGMELLGAAASDDVVGRPIFDFVHPDQHQYTANTIRRIIAGSGTGYSEYQLCRLNGEIVEVEACSTTVNEFLGKSVIQTVIRDISERKRTEAFLRRSDKLSAVGQLAAGVAHEIRNPLTAIKGFVQLLQSRTNENGSYLEIMLSELERINTIVSEFMLLAKPEQAMNHQRKDLRKLIEDILTLLNPQALLNNVEVQTDFDPEVRAIQCDEAQMKQVFVNVIKNAIEAMPNGGQLAIQVKPKNKRHVMIRFVDQGAGIPKERLSKLGEPFYSTKEKGTGLGLMMCYKIIEAHRGELLVKSKLNKGTTIDVVLPIVPEHP
ncbi:PAS domain S-box protein [Paenibacillus sp. MWE-103]|uniref:histidine kinase n=1 Tax=Paenibacillus artemisiicola TaxID=1172618 RepID=A0ABS3W6L7_9BACL|nr:PAS domain S-box protein [Paenibacillus artemisiicola]MBO7743956.1 PAS domain S-box protein [Paenibacillus artemisiicola]